MNEIQTFSTRVSDVFDWVCERVFEGHEGRFVVAMVLLFAAVGGME